MHWGEIFFLLHKHCNLNKWEIWEYTLPQITELMKQISKYVEYEVRINSLPFEMFGTFTDGGDDGKKEVGIKEDGYKVATEEDIDLLAQFLGGGL